MNKCSLAGAVLTAASLSLSVWADQSSFSSLPTQKYRNDMYSVPGWPSGEISNGSVSNASINTGDFNYETLKQRRVDAVFTYAVNGGNDTTYLQKIPLPFKTINLIIQSRSLEEAYGTGQTVMPVIVVYTAGGSLGAEAIKIDLGWDPIKPDNLWLRYYNLVRIAQEAQRYKDDRHPVPATFVVNPDFLGEVHKSCQLNNCVIPYKTATVGVGPALVRAFDELVADGYLDAAPAIPEPFTEREASFADYVNSVSWVIKTFAADVAFGWQDNIWAGDDVGHIWIHRAATASDNTILQQHIDNEAEYLKFLNIYGADNPYRPHFLAFDKWERDNWDSSLLGAGINFGYMYNAPAWRVYFDFIMGVDQALDNVPIMLFQIPGGHLQVVNDVDPRNDHASTAPDYILGDTNLAPGLTNVKPYIFDVSFENALRDYNIPMGTSVKDYISTCPVAGCAHPWHASHWQELKNNNVFSILWGGGSTTSIVGYTADRDDSGWLYQRLMEVR